MTGEPFVVTKHYKEVEKQNKISAEKEKKELERLIKENKKNKEWVIDAIGAVHLALDRGTKPGELVRLQKEEMRAFRAQEKTQTAIYAIRKRRHRAENPYTFWHNWYVWDD